MNVNVLRALLAAASLLGLLADDARACSCPRSGPPCQATWSADVVFLGTVRSIEEVPHETLGSRYTELLVSFDVDRGIVNATTGRLDVVTGRGGGSCGYAFKAGRRYLVYAWKGPGGGLSTGICSRTRPVEDAEEDLRYLASIAAESSGARVYGRVTESRREAYEREEIDFGPVEGLIVNVTGAAFSRDAVTDRNGRYEITGIPTGNVTVLVLAPPEYDPQYLKREIKLKDPRACSLNDFQLRQTATVTGLVLDAAGRPAVGVSIDAVAAELAAHRPPAYHYPARTDRHGRFEFDTLPPGSYVFGVHLTSDAGRGPSGVPVFLPGTGNDREAAVFDLKPGERRDLGVLRLPAAVNP
ncbi:MAG TPA: hypothetical protein VD833_15855 [Vicinamibacterales bacterium]|nr:hypothetical protein [Vicinamibacterales bacterium]